MFTYAVFVVIVLFYIVCVIFPLCDFNYLSMYPSDKVLIFEVPFLFSFEI